MSLHLKPTLMGAAMGLMMLWMMHDSLMRQDADVTALLVFTGLHVLVFEAIAVATLFGSRLSPTLKRVVAKLHRPSRKHIASMLVGMGAAITLTHLFVHGWTS